MSEAAMYAQDPSAYQALLHKAPWRQDPRYFQRVCISVMALLKMVLHAQSGGDLEVMGLMQGHVRGDTIYVLDAFPLPVHGTETRVNAQNEAYEYMVMYLEACRSVHRPEHAIGWYHSHPGYGCWLSGIDVQTQRTNQQQDPFVAVVIDPWRTMSTGHVDIGAFRTWPLDQPSTAPDTTAPPPRLPAHKIDDYGAHASQYYELDVQFIKIAADRPLYDQLWQQYWAQVLCSPPNASLQPLHELGTRLGEIAATIESTSTMPGGTSYAQAARAVPRSDGVDVQALAQQLDRRADGQPLEQASQDAYSVAADMRYAIERARRKTMLFGL
ncbi:COP9 signalosome complex subunit 5 [Malassezia restricta]|uniref:COP9 signalosome complex subunit 5 n=1 Tax=Malassezia restricta TaxID=76775 RepID=UPI000DD12C60|nr:COP9 signalosome complex subunit 5 [Malassezia restricta]AXA48800.1 COP9 signalosome complex subunit 5 [Malassezia restricta]